MKHEAPRKRTQPAPSADHPWNQRARRQVAEIETRKKRDLRVTTVEDKVGWTCPSCGKVSCDFGECTGGDF